MEVLPRLLHRPIEKAKPDVEGGILTNRRNQADVNITVQAINKI